MKLLVSQKDEIFDLINNSEWFSPSQFKLIEIGTREKGVNTELKFENSEYYFRFFEQREYHGVFVANYSPGEKLLFEATSSLDWDLGIIHFENWLRFLHREINAPDKWSRLLKELSNIQILSETDEAKFSYREYIELTDKISQIKGLIKTVPLLVEQQNAIIDKLDHLTELARELNKFDWKSLFIGTISSIIIQLSVTKENALQIWALIKKVFNNFFLP